MLKNPESAARARGRLGLWLFGWSVVSCWALDRSASTPRPSINADEYVRQLELSYRGVSTLRADFIQNYVWGERKRLESGIVYLARGGLMRWDYQKPIAKLFLSDGKKLLLYIPEENQVTRSPVKSSEDIRAPFRLLLSRLNLRKVFSKIEFADASPGVPPENRLLRAFPKRGYEEEYREVQMELTPEFDIRRLVISYPDHSTMEFTFDHIERNVALSPGFFRFFPPPGAEVIDQ